MKLPALVMGDLVYGPALVDYNAGVVDITRVVGSKEPFSENSFASALPTPDPAPVINAIFPSKRFRGLPDIFPFSPSYGKDCVK